MYGCVCVSFFLGGREGAKRLLPMFSRTKNETIQLGVCFFFGWKQFLPGSAGIVGFIEVFVDPKSCGGK